MSFWCLCSYFIPKTKTLSIVKIIMFMITHVWTRAFGDQGRETNTHIPGVTHAHESGPHQPGRMEDNSKSSCEPKTVTVYDKVVNKHIGRIVTLLWIELNELKGTDKLNNNCCKLIYLQCVLHRQSAIHFSILPLRPSGWRGIVVTVRAGGRAAGKLAELISL